jgi:hypothetical protein
MAWRKPDDMRWDISVNDSSTVLLKYEESMSQDEVKV